MKSFLFNNLKSIGVLSLVILNTSLIIHAQSPGGVSADNTLWLKANEGVTLTNQNVTEWEEFSGAAVTGNFEVINPGPGGTTQQAPSFNENGINFNPYIVFQSNQPNSLSSSNQFTGSSLFTHQNLTMFQVINLKHTVGTGVWVKWQTSNSTTDRLGNEVNNGGANAGRQRFDLRGVNLFSGEPITNKHSLVTNYTRPGNVNTRLSGAHSNSINSMNTPANNNNSRISFGNESQSGGDPYPTTIDMAEIIIFKRDLTEDEINKVESYLAIKYGFTLLQTGANANNYTASDNTVVWNNANNSDYIYNITGVARDDASALYQKQSKSINADALLSVYVGNMTNGNLPTTNADNNQTINADLSYLIFGDNNASLDFTSCTPDGRAMKMDRVWKVQHTGNLPLATIVFDAADIPAASQLLISDDPNFLQNVHYVPLNTNGNQKLGLFNINHGQYFTFTNDPIQLTADIQDLICEGDRGGINLTVEGGSAPYSYLWSPSGSTQQNLEDILQGIHTVTVTHGDNCQYSEGFMVENEMRVMTMMSKVESAYCNGANGKALITVTGGHSPLEFEIGNQTQEENYFTSLTPGQHTVKVKDARGCELTDQISIPNINYDLKLEMNGENAYCDLDSKGGWVNVKVKNNYYPPFFYNWSGYPNEEGDSLTNLPEGQYGVTVADNNGCTGTSFIAIGEYPCCQLILPNAFTPNGDGLNDKFEPAFVESMSTYQINIFNRYGQLVFTSDKADVNWDGTINGKAAPIGVYFYYGKYTCMGTNKLTEFNGEFTLLR